MVSFFEADEGHLFESGSDASLLAMINCILSWVVLKSFGLTKRQHSNASTNQPVAYKQSES